MRSRSVRTRTSGSGSSTHSSPRPDEGAWYSRCAPTTRATRGDPGLAVLVERACSCSARCPPSPCGPGDREPRTAARAGARAGLTDLLVREIEGEPGALPLLSHALRETWLRHEGRTLTVAGYQASGGVRGAVAQSAEALYGGLGEDERTQLRDLVLRLVVPGTRRRTAARRGAAPPDGRGPDPGPAHRPDGHGPAGHQRRRHDRARTRGRGPRLATTARLARGRPRGTADPPPPHPGRRGLGRIGAPAQRPLPRHTPRRDPRVGRLVEAAPHRPRAAIPGRQRGTGRCRRGVSGRARPHPWTHGPTTALRPRRGRRAPRPGSDDRLRGGGPDRAGS